MNNGIDNYNYVIDENENDNKMFNELEIVTQRNLTKEEEEAYLKGLEKISKPTGFKLF